MSYNYSKDFLQTHDAIVQELITCANEGGIKEIAFEDNNAMRNAQYLVNNLLASLEMNYPEQFKGIRQRVRTWTASSGEGSWTLYIGLPRHTIRGGKPRSLPTTLQMQDSRGGFIAKMPSWAEFDRSSSNIAEITYDKPFTGNASVYPLVTYLVSVPDITQAIWVNAVGDWEPHKATLEESIKSLGWGVEVAGPDRLRLVRTGNEEWRNIGRGL